MNCASISIHLRLVPSVKYLQVLEMKEKSSLLWVPRAINTTRHPARQLLEPFLSFLKVVDAGYGALPVSGAVLVVMPSTFRPPRQGTYEYEKHDISACIILTLPSFSGVSGMTFISRSNLCLCMLCSRSFCCSPDTSIASTLKTANRYFFLWCMHFTKSKQV